MARPGLGPQANEEEAWRAVLDAFGPDLVDGRREKRGCLGGRTAGVLDVGEDLEAFAASLGGREEAEAPRDDLLLVFRFEAMP